MLRDDDDAIVGVLRVSVGVTREDDGCDVITEPSTSSCVEGEDRGFGAAVAEASAAVSGSWVPTGVTFLMDVEGSATVS
jgi:hypothetical protein